ncbi:MAG TPA: hypothetical protein VEB18_01285 [Candidatus Paceibacterota bacterium]|nr:hypothetical protein [Candidatus Paceibacterota bacterium]
MNLTPDRRPERGDGQGGSRSPQPPNTRQPQRADDDGMSFEDAWNAMNEAWKGMLREAGQLRTEAQEAKAAANQEKARADRLQEELRVSDSEKKRLFDDNTRLQGLLDQARNVIKKFAEKQDEARAQIRDDYRAITEPPPPERTGRGAERHQ